jgi:hypothetical protein
MLHRFRSHSRRLRHGGAARAAPPRPVATARPAGAKRSSLRAVRVRLLLTAAVPVLPLPGSCPADAACLSSPTHVLSFFSSDGPRFGVDEALRPEVEAAAVPRSVPVRVAYELHQAGHRYLDVRCASTIYNHTLSASVSGHRSV